MAPYLSDVTEIVIVHVLGLTDSVYPESLYNSANRLFKKPIVNGTIVLYFLHDSGPTVIQGSP